MITDTFTLQQIQTLHPAIRQEVLELYGKICEALQGKATCRFTQTYRSLQEQDALYAQGRTLPGKIVTRARGGYSYHNYGLAFDIVLLVQNPGGKPGISYDTQKDFDGDKHPDWQEVVALCKQYGFEWGGDWHFKDLPHFQKTFGYSVRTLLLRLQSGKTLLKEPRYPKLR